MLKWNNQKSNAKVYYIFPNKIVSILMQKTKHIYFRIFVLPSKHEYILRWKTHQIRLYLIIYTHVDYVAAVEYVRLVAHQILTISINTYQHLV